MLCIKTMLHRVGVTSTVSPAKKSETIGNLRRIRVSGCVNLASVNLDGQRVRGFWYSHCLMRGLLAWKSG